MTKLVMVSCLVSGERVTAFVRLPVGKAVLPESMFRRIFNPPIGSTICFGF